MKTKRSGVLILIKMKEFKELDRLSQLDRIEFRQKYANMDKNGFNLGLFPCCWYLLILACLFGLNGYVEVSLRFFDFIWAVLIVQTIFIIIDIVSSRNGKKKLFEEYFEINPRGKK